MKYQRKEDEQQGHSSAEIAAAEGLDLLKGAGHLLRRNHQRAFDLFVKIVGADITRQQFVLLFTLKCYPDVSQKRLVDLTGFDKATLAEMLGRLVAKGWITRERDPADRRAWIMRITSEGQAKIDEHMEKVMAVQEEILAPLPPHLRPVLIECLRLMLGLENP